MDGEVCFNLKAYSKVGEYHKSLGKENEDSVSFVYDGRRLFVAISDAPGVDEAASVSDLAASIPALTSSITAKTVIMKCLEYGEEFFDDRQEKAIRRMVFDLQREQRKKAKDLNIEFEEMKSTLVLLCVDNEMGKYVTVHIGDGMIAEQTEEEDITVRSYPENARVEGEIKKSLTYFCNRKDVFKHLRVSSGVFKKGDAFFSCSDGAMQDCNTTSEYKTRVLNIEKIKSFIDDCTYCQVSTEML